MQTLLKRESAPEGVEGMTLEVVLRDATANDRDQVLADLEQFMASAGYGRSAVRVLKEPKEHKGPNFKELMGDAMERGERRLVTWTQDGTLLTVSAVETAWGIKRQSVDAARERNEIFSLYVRGQHWYPAEALKFDRASLAKIVQELGDLGSTTKLLFILRRHDGLKGMTPLEAVEKGMLEKVMGIAEAERHG